MNIKNHHIAKAILIASLLITPSCSTKKKSWAHRQYHNTTAKYNGYFNGKTSLKLGVKKIHKNHIDDYTTILPVYRTGDLSKSKKTHSYMDKAIKKGSIVIQKHSIKIRGKEYCKWIDDNYLLVGKAYFYKGESDEAIKTFSFIKNEYKKNEIRFEASLWLIRSYVQKKDFIAAEIELDELENERKFPKKLEIELTKVRADYYLQQNNFPLALEQLKNIDQKVKRKRKKVRYNYIMAQIYQQHDNYNKATKQYEIVLKSNAEYDMIFNAKMNLARSLESGSKDGEKMRQKLLKMTKDDKNKEYLDQIYYTLAEIDLNSTDTLNAINNYLLSTINSVNNDGQKALSFLALGKIEFNRSRYKEAKTYYDSTLYYMDEDYRIYSEIEDKHTILTDLVLNLEIIQLQDSIQILAQLPTEQLNKIISEIIKNEIKREKEEMNVERAKQQVLYENNRNDGRREQFGNNTSGGKWYFYNPATLSFGLSEFRKKWGKRKLEDDWRRKDKKSSNIFNVDSIPSDPSTVTSKNKQDPQYYLNQLPKTTEDFETSDTKIKEALYQAGVIYRDDLQKYNKSSEMFKQIPFRYPGESEYSPLSYYNVYMNYIKQNKTEDAEKIKITLLKNHPNSICAKILINPKFKTELIAKNNEPEIAYQKTLKQYLNQNYTRVLSLTENISEEFSSKYMLLRALSFAGINDTINFKKELHKIIKTNQDEEIIKETKYILEAINNPLKMKRANELALAASSYLFKENDPHMLLVILPKEGLDINYFKTIISDYHAKDFENEVFEISAMLLGIENHLLIIKRFKDAPEVLSYRHLFNTAESITKLLKNTEHKVIPISVDNFKEFYKNKDIKGYSNFFKKNYLDNN